MRLLPIVVLIVVYVLLTSVFGLPGNITAPVLIVLGIGALVYFGGRLYKPFYVGKDARCIARGVSQRRGCRHFMFGARMGGGCGRLMENGRCRYVR